MVDSRNSLLQLMLPDTTVCPAESRTPSEQSIVVLSFSVTTSSSGDMA